MLAKDNQVRFKVTLLPISSTIIRAEKIAVVVRVAASAKNGLNNEGTIIAIEPSTFDKRRLIKYLGQVEDNFLTEVKSILKFYLNL